MSRIISFLISKFGDILAGNVKSPANRKQRIKDNGTTALVLGGILLVAAGEAAFFGMPLFLKGLAQTVAAVLPIFICWAIYANCIEPIIAHVQYERACIAEYGEDDWREQKLEWRARALERTLREAERTLIVNPAALEAEVEAQRNENLGIHRNRTRS